MSAKKKRKIPLHIELILVFVIVMFQIITMATGNSIISQLSDVGKYGFMNTDVTDDADIMNSLQDYDLNFSPNTCKMISMYDQDLNLILRFVFMETPGANAVRTNYSFREYVMTHDGGYMDIDIDNTTEHVFFRWIPDPHGTAGKTLIVVRVNHPTYLYVWLYPILSILNVILIFALVITMMNKRQQDGIEHYKSLTRERRNL